MPSLPGNRPRTVTPPAAALAMSVCMLFGARAEPISLMGPEPVATPVVERTGEIDRRPVVEQAPPDAAEDGSPLVNEHDLGAPGTDLAVEPDALAGMLMAGGIIIITFILMARLRKGKRRTAPSTESPAEQIAQIRARAGDRNSIEAYKADAEDFTRRMAAILDNRAERLEQLIADADERLTAIRRAEDSGADHAELGDPPRLRHPSRPDPGPTTDPLHDKIYRLADSGLDPISIARETGQPTGQVELILALRA